MGITIFSFLVCYICFCFALFFETFDNNLKLCVKIIIFLKVSDKFIITTFWLLFFPIIFLMPLFICVNFVFKILKKTLDIYKSIFYI